MRKATLLATLVAGISAMAMQAAHAVEIQYWQYVFDTRVKAMDELIANFQKANPDITVKQVTFPYDSYQTRVIAAKLSGQGPDVLQLFYGWTDKFVQGGVLQPLPKDAFPAAEIEKEFFPIVSAMKRGDDYYGLPTAVRSLALFYNKKAFTDAGLDPANPPKTLDELVAAAEKTTKRDGAGNIEQEGITLDMGGQDHHWWREVLIRQNGGVPYTDNDRKVAYNDDAGKKALKFYTDLQTEKKVGLSGFMDEGQAAFKAGKAAMTIDGTFRLGAFKAIKDFEWGVTELPANAAGERSNYASYFANGIGAAATGEKLEASKKFLAYISSPEAMDIWLKTVGELPARRSAALTEANLADPIYAPFLKGLEYAHTTMFVDEAAQRQTTVDMVNRVLLEGQSVDDSIAAAATAEQAILDAAK
ncbi:ABC transporter substrate-binding protein [Salmonella enterica subsp. enterica serovar Newport]|nr:ABC transporter substrate-binding protein [Salmonella enterica subsp. enterica serovar Newport]